MQFAIVDQAEKKIVEKELQPGWNALVGSLGCHYWPRNGCIRLSNGVYDGAWVGGVYISHIEINGSRRGNGREYLPPRSVLYLDTFGGARPGHATAGVVGGVPVPFSQDAASMHRARGEATYTEALGDLWKVAGVPQPNPPGVEWIEPVCGWQMNGPFHWERHKATMGRTALDCLQAANGEPYRNPARNGYYTGSRGWGKVTQLPRFAALNSDQYDDRRMPIDWNTGNCPYRDRLLGLNQYNGWLPSDDQHLGNTTASAKALDLVGWEPAQFDLSMIGWDCSYARDSIPATVAGQGSDFYGRRAVAWSIDTMRMDRQLFPRSRLLVDQTLKAMTPAGQVMRVSEGSQAAQGFSPALWTAGPGVPDPLPTSEDIGYTYELWLTAYALATHGEWRAVQKIVNGMFAASGVFPSIVKKRGYVPKGVAVGRKDGVAYPVIAAGAGIPDFMPSIGIGLLACQAIHEGRNPKKYLEFGLLFSTPTQGKATTLIDLRNRLRNEWGGRSQVVCLLSALERSV